MLLVVFGEAAVVPVALADVCLMFRPSPLEIHSGANIVPGGGAGAEYVIDAVPGGAGGPPLKPPLPPVRPAGDPGDLQCSAVQCSAVQCSAVQCSAVQCSEVQ